MISGTICIEGQVVHFEQSMEDGKVLVKICDTLSGQVATSLTTGPIFAANLALALGGESEEFALPCEYLTDGLYALAEPLAGSMDSKFRIIP